MSKYSRDFKLEAVNAYLSQNDSQQQIAAVFAICPRQLRDWVSIYQRYGAAALAPCEQHREYSTEFKLTVLNYKRQHQASAPETALHFQIPSASTIRVWEQRYNQGGTIALANRPGRPAMKTSKNPTDPQIASKPWSELSSKELLREIEYLQAENAYLKKLDALIREETLAQKSKPGRSKD
jgi:transposase-like protein